MERGKPPTGENLLWNHTAIVFYGDNVGNCFFFYFYPHKFPGTYSPFPLPNFRAMFRIRIRFYSRSGSRSSPKSECFFFGSMLQVLVDAGCEWWTKSCCGFNYCKQSLQYLLLQNILVQPSRKLFVELNVPGSVFRRPSNTDLESPWKGLWIRNTALMLNNIYISKYFSCIKIRSASNWSVKDPVYSLYFYFSETNWYSIEVIYRYSTYGVFVMLITRIVCCVLGGGGG